MSVRPSTLLSAVAADQVSAAVPFLMVMLDVCASGSKRPKEGDTNMQWSRIVLVVAGAVLPVAAKHKSALIPRE